MPALQEQYKRLLDDSILRLDQINISPYFSQRKGNLLAELKESKTQLLRLYGILPTAKRIALKKKINRLQDNILEESKSEERSYFLTKRQKLCNCWSDNLAFISGIIMTGAGGFYNYSGLSSNEEGVKKLKTLFFSALQANSSDEEASLRLAATEKQLDAYSSQETAFYLIGSAGVLLTVYAMGKIIFNYCYGDSRIEWLKESTNLVKAWQKFSDEVSKQVEEFKKSLTDADSTLLKQVNDLENSINQRREEIEEIYQQNNNLDLQASRQIYDDIEKCVEKAVFKQIPVDLNALRQALELEIQKLDAHTLTLNTSINEQIQQINQNPDAVPVGILSL